MKINFLGTRAYIDAKSDRHNKQSSIKFSYYNRDIIVDCGEDWVNKVSNWHVDAILITHAHPDHAFGLKNGAPCPVYATNESWEVMKNLKIDDRVTIEKRSPIKIPQDKSHFFNVEAFPVLHSTRAPAVGYRIKAGNAKIFYVPDVVYIKDREDAMKGVDYYIGDGSTVKRSLVRKPGDTIVGHVPIQTQLTWCQKTGVSKAIFTHIGSQIVQGNEKEINQQIQAMAKERKLDEVIIAFDGMEITVR